MKHILTITFALLWAANLNATTIDLGPDRLSYSEGFDFNAINGAAGGPESIDIQFNKAVHVFYGTDINFQVGLTFLTTSQGSFLTGTGQLLDANGNPICDVRTLGSANTNTGFIFVGLYPLYSEDGGVATDLIKPFDFYGVHFDLTIPETTILGGSFYISTLDYGKPFRIGPHVPEGEDATIGLLFLGWISLMALNNRKGAK